MQTDEQRQARLTEELRANAEQLLPQLYPELRRAARGVRARVSAGSTLQTTALIHEAYLKLARGGEWTSRRHFLAAAAIAMRHILVDQARARLSQRRGQGAHAIPIDEAWRLVENGQPLLAVEECAIRVAVGDALEALARLEPRLARVVECRYFAGFTDVETAEILGLTERTVQRDWVKARAWLRHALTEDQPL